LILYLHFLALDFHFLVCGVLISLRFGFEFLALGFQFLARPGQSAGATKVAFFGT
jgi:hypothetical protein